MVDTEHTTPFVDLPAALVEEMLQQTAVISESLLDTFRRVKADRTTLRAALFERGLVTHESKLGYPPLPTTCGVDGSYAIERLLTADLAAAAAVAVEGLIPPSEKRHWEQPHHLAFIQSEVHHSDTATVLRSVMLGNELLLAIRAPHDLVLMDMTLTLPIIYFNQALNRAPDCHNLACSQEFLRRCSEYLDAYRTMLQSERSDKHYIGLPKYSTRREIGTMMGWPTEHDDRGLLTLLLRPGEFTRPQPLQPPDEEWHLNLNRLPSPIQSRVREAGAQIVTSLAQMQVFYYKPHDWLPALRVEVAHSVAANPHRLAVVLQGLKHQCATASMLEPYPQYMADRMAKALTRAIPAFRQVATQQISETYDDDIGEVFFAMHGYRSESGR